jgi:membrane fusion protein (multidrug efflux system)
MHPSSFRWVRKSALAALAPFFLLVGCEQQAAENPRQMQAAVPVITTIASLQPIADRIEAVGTTRASDSIDIAARVSNAVARIGFIEGAFVERGHVLVELESSEARARLAEAEATLAEIRSASSCSRSRCSPTPTPAPTTRAS